MARFDQLTQQTVRAPSVGPKIKVGPGTPDNAGDQGVGILLGRVKILLASGGMVTGVTGMNGVTASRSATGTYSLTIPPVASLSDVTVVTTVKPVASGIMMSGQLPGGSIYSGTYLLGIAAAGGLGVNGSAGDEINVIFYVDPSTLEGAVP